MSEVSASMLRAWTEYEPPETAGAMSHRAICLQRHAFYAGYSAAISTARRQAIEECARVAEKFHLPGGYISDWLEVNESPAEAQRRHIAQAIRALDKEES